MKQPTPDRQFTGIGELDAPILDTTRPTVSDPVDAVERGLAAASFLIVVRG